MKRFFFCLFTLLAVSCAKQLEPSIPYYPVYVEIDLNQEWRLQAPQASKIFNQSNIDQELERGKTGLGGVLVYYGLSVDGSKNMYYAFDAACPHEASKNTVLEVVDDIYAVCPKCGSKYEILTGVGNPKEGPSTKYLQRYSVSVNGSKIYVRN